MLYRRNKSKGFTLIELLVIIAVVAILAALTMFAFGDWRERTAKTEVQTSLTQLVSALKDYSNFNNGYPVPPTTTYTNTNYKQQDNVTITYTGTASTYCAQGTSTSVTSVVYKVTHDNQTPVAGSC